MMTHSRSNRIILALTWLYRCAATGERHAQMDNMLTSSLHDYHCSGHDGGQDFAANMIMIINILCH